MKSIMEETRGITCSFVRAIIGEGRVDKVNAQILLPLVLPVVVTLLMQ
jgi:hypothetical protein